MAFQTEEDIIFQWSVVNHLTSDSNFIASYPYTTAQQERAPVERATYHRCTLLSKNFRRYGSQTFSMFVRDSIPLSYNRTKEESNSRLWKIKYSWHQVEVARSKFRNRPKNDLVKQVL